MGRRATIFWHAALSVAASVLYFFFVLPRWPELMGDTSHGLGTVARIAAGILIALAALPVVFTLLESRKPEFGTPALALTLRTYSIVAHVLAGVLIVGTAISEIWLSLDSAGRWLFGVYGAAAAIALVAIAGFYLSFVAESPPPPPKPLKPKKEKKPRRRRGRTDDETDDIADAQADATEAEAVADVDDEVDESAEVEATAEEPESTAEEATAVDQAKDTVAAESGGLRNRRPSGKMSHRRRRSRRGVPVVDVDE
jgi:MFS family permease